MSWTDIRAEHVERAGGEAAVEAGKRKLVAEVIGTASPRSSGPRA